MIRKLLDNAFPHLKANNENRDFPPPYDVITYFAIDYNLVLDCMVTDPKKKSLGCHLPNNTTSSIAAVNAISA